MSPPTATDPCWLGRFIYSADRATGAARQRKIRLWAQVLPLVRTNQCNSASRWEAGCLAQHNVEPHRGQKPRLTPGDELNCVIVPCVTATALFSNDTKTFAGAPLCRRQLSQWHQRTHFGLPLASKRTAPQRQRPVDITHRRPCSVWVWPPDRDRARRASWSLLTLEDEKIDHFGDVLRRVLRGVGPQLSHAGGELLIR
jgi:hypothetical protein